MAKIALIAEELNSVSLAFGLSLHQQMQDVLFLTSANAEFSQVPKFPIMTPFRNWSFFEGMRALPQVTTWNPDVWHFLFTSENFKTRPAHWVLSSFASALPGKTLAVSFFSANQVKTMTDRAFLRFFDLRTFGSRSHLMRVKRQASLGHRGINEILPPVEYFDPREADRIRPEIERLSQNLSPFVLMPDPPSPHLDPNLFRNRGMEVLLLSDRFKSKTPFYYSGRLSWAEREFLMKNARALVLAGCDLSVIELRRFHELAERTETPLVVTQFQNEVLPGLCMHQKSGWILDQGVASLTSLLDSNPKLELAKGFAGVSRFELTDSTLNELLRMYQRAFSIRWS